MEVDKWRSLFSHNNNNEIYCCYYYISILNYNYTPECYYCTISPTLLRLGCDVLCSPPRTRVSDRDGLRPTSLPLGRSLQGRDSWSWICCLDRRYLEWWDQRRRIPLYRWWPYARWWIVFSSTSSFCTGGGLPSAACSLGLVRPLTGTSIGFRWIGAERCWTARLLRRWGSSHLLAPVDDRELSLMEIGEQPVIVRERALDGKWALAGNGGRAPENAGGRAPWVVGERAPEDDDGRVPEDNTGLELAAACSSSIRLLLIARWSDKNQALLNMIVAELKSCDD